MTRILVTGATGQIASSLRERAASAGGLDLYCLGRPELDLAEAVSIERVIAETRPDIVINAAAYTNVDQAEDEPEEAAKVNARAPGILGHAAQRVGARIIHLSTDYVFDGLKPEPYQEIDAVGPRSVYGRTKLDGERALLQTEAECIILRTSWVYSPFSRNFVRTMLGAASQRPQLSVVDDQVGNPTSALDIADAAFAILNHWKDHPRAGLGEVYHCAGTGAASWCELAKATFAFSRDLQGPHADVVPIGTDQWPSKAVRPRYSMLDCAKLNRDFQWSAPHWRQSLQLVVSRLVAGQ